MSDTPNVGERWYVSVNPKVNSDITIGEVLYVEDNPRRGVVIRTTYGTDLISSDRLIGKLPDSLFTRICKAFKWKDWK